MPHYLRDGPNGMEIWEITDALARRADVHTSGDNLFLYNAPDGGTGWDALRSNTPWLDGDQNPFHRTLLAPGEFFPRMARRSSAQPDAAHSYNPGFAELKDSVAVLNSQLIALKRQLEAICRTVHPIEGNLSTFGHEIRNLLILACTEVENLWRVVLVANGVDGDRLKTSDYVKLKAAMKLGEYAVQFPSYPWLSAFSPYKNWTIAEPTKSLAWYDSYNGVKHNREEEFARASLRAVFDALAACVIMLAAQFPLRTSDLALSELWSFFRLSKAPTWTLSECYVLPLDQRGWRPVNFDFS